MTDAVDPSFRPSFEPVYWRPATVVIVPPPVVCMACRGPVSVNERLFIGPRGSYLMHTSCGVQVAIAAEIVETERTDS